MKQTFSLPAAPVATVYPGLDPGLVSSVYNSMQQTVQFFSLNNTLD